MFGCKGLFPAEAGGHGHRSALGSAAGRGVGPHGKEQGLISGKSRLVKYYNLARTMLKTLIRHIELPDISHTLRRHMMVYIVRVC